MERNHKHKGYGLNSAHNTEVKRKIAHAKRIIKNCYRKDGKVHPGLDIVIERKMRLIARLQNELTV